MIYRLSAKVRSLRPLTLPVSPRILSNGFSLRVIAEADETAYTLVLERAFRPAPSELPTVRRADGFAAEINFPVNDQSQEARLFLQFIHAAGSFLIGIHDVHLNGATEEWVPETDEERLLIKIRTVTRTESDWPEDQGIAPHLGLDDLCENYAGWRELVVPLTLLREGRELYRVRRYFDAFIYLYLYLEGMYGHGKTGNSPVKQAFRTSDSLQRAITQFLHNIEASNPEDHSARLDALLVEFGLTRTIDGVIDLIVELRGTIFHYTRRGTRRTVNPIRTHEYRTPAYMLMTLATLTACLELPATASRPIE